LSSFLASHGPRFEVSRAVSSANRRYCVASSHHAILRGRGETSGWLDPAVMPAHVAFDLPWLDGGADLRTLGASTPFSGSGLGSFGRHSLLRVGRRLRVARREGLHVALRSSRATSLAIGDMHVGPEAQQIPSDPVISESYRGSEHALPDPKNCMVAARANVGFHKY
jgi:hypothetical protein